MHHAEPAEFKCYDKQAVTGIAPLAKYPTSLGAGLQKRRAESERC